MTIHAPNVKIDPVMEAIAKRLSGIEQVPIEGKRRMIKSAAKAGAEAVRKETDRRVKPNDEFEQWWNDLSDKLLMTSYEIAKAAWVAGGKIKKGK